MKVVVCDLCLINGKVNLAKMTCTFKSPVKGNLKMDLCQACSDTHPNGTLTRESASDLLIKAYDKFATIA